MAYLAADAFNNILSRLIDRFPAVCRDVQLPNRSFEGRIIRGIRIGVPDPLSLFPIPSIPKRTVLLFGGCHARELVNPDLLIKFAADLLVAYDRSSDLSFGNVVYDAMVVRHLLQMIDIIVVPLINPDGRAYEQSGTNLWWRKNRNPNPGETCAGVDLNRNYDFLWSSVIGASNDSCSPLYHGRAPFSEPETRNIRYLLEEYPEIDTMVDVHSYSELVLFPWGDDQTQTSDPRMNFRNPVYDGERGLSGDTYKEYMRTRDYALFRDMGSRMREKIGAVRGHYYRMNTSYVGLYPTSGSATDYAYSRHLVDPGKSKVYAYLLETGRDFQPRRTEAIQVMTEVCAGLFELCLATACPLFSSPHLFSSQRDRASVATTLDLFHQPSVRKTKLRRHFESLLTEHLMEIRELMAKNQTIHRAVARLLRSTDKIADLQFANPPRAIDARLVRSVERALSTLSHARGLSPKAKKILDEICNDMHLFEGKTFFDGLKLTGRRKIIKRKA